MYVCDTEYKSVCVCVQVRRLSSSALGKVFSTMPFRATTPVSLPMDKLVTEHVLPHDPTVDNTLLCLVTKTVAQIKGSCHLRSAAKADGVNNRADNPSYLSLHTVSTRQIF